MSLLNNYTVGKVVNPFLWEDGKYLVENTFIGEKKVILGFMCPPSGLTTKGKGTF